MTFMGQRLLSFLFGIVAFESSWRTAHSFIIYAGQASARINGDGLRANFFPLTRIQYMNHDDSNDYEPSSHGEAAASDGNDWMVAELTLRNSPTQPSPDLEPEQVLSTCLRSLQFVDHPHPSAGLERVFPFFTWECRKVVTARMGGDTVERFAEHGALAPALLPFMGATRIVVGEGTVTRSAGPARGDMISFPVKVHGSMALSFRHPSGMMKDGVSLTPPVTDMVLRLERNRRPPLQDCWLVREVLDVRYAFQGDMGNIHVGG